MEVKEPLDDALIEKLRGGKMVQLAPKGFSMTPFIRGGQDKVLVRRGTDVKVGDIVLVVYGGNMILHRVYAINGSQITLMGDGNLQGTEEVALTEVLGTVIQIIKPNGRCRKPKKAWLWRHMLPIRRYLLKVDRKWNKYFRKQQ